MRAKDLRIPQPCDQDWTRMRGQAGVRHCQACDKDVVDLTGWTAREVETFLHRKDSRVCVRLPVDRAGRPVFAKPRKPQGTRTLVAVAALSLATAACDSSQPLALSQDAYEQPDGSEVHGAGPIQPWKVQVLREVPQDAEEPIADDRALDDLHALAERALEGAMPPPGIWDRLQDQADRLQLAARQILDEDVAPCVQDADDPQPQMIMGEIAEMPEPVVRHAMGKVAPR